MEADGDVVVFHLCGDIEVDGRIDADGVRKVDIAALKLVFRSGKGGTAIVDLDAAQDGGYGCRAANGEIYRACELGIGVLKVQLRGAGDVHIETDLIRRGVRIG